ncbi:hypothetical protein TIFTF001_033358 [Ficus carica]|uniref:Uncharacterized protein n=1 Tax=Ficus carica TaxID=3494 RepID=A0AA88J7R8_FICCA|nr:hypothetical protein TIFTF001_033358 [Ficus carica]
MRLQWPLFLLKPEPDRAQDPCAARIDTTRDLNVLKAERGFTQNTKVNIERDSVLTESSTTSDTANANKVSNLTATIDTRWRSVAGRAVKCGNICRYAFRYLRGSLQQGSLPSNTEDPRREGKKHCKAILLRSGKEIEPREKPKAVQNEPTSIQEQDEQLQKEEK